MHHIVSESSRIAPTKRPPHSHKVVGHQRWRDLLFLHWPIDAALLQPMLPKRLSVDTFEGTAYIGIVPFAMFDVAPSWLPRPFAFNFLETNLRTYVHLEGEQPGVYFFSLEAASWLAVQAARVGWSLPYYHAGMRSDRCGDTIAYESIRHRPNQPHFSTTCEIGEQLPTAAPDSLEFFLFERYLLYTEHRNKLLCGQVHHPPYPTHQVACHECHEELIAAAGLPAPNELPHLAHFSPGVDVEIFDLLPVRP